MRVIQTGSMDILSALIENIITIDYDALPVEAVEMTKKQILDALACFVSGSSGPRMRELVEIITEWGGKDESTIAIYGNRVPSPNAALVNGAMGSIWDLDDNLDIDAVHAEVPVVAAGLAIAERKGAVRGKEFITAVALGIDLGYRLKLANTRGLDDTYGWDYSSTYGYFSAAATSAKILGIDRNKLRHAFGIVYHQAGGAGMGLYPLEGASTKELGRGFAAKGGVVAAILADRGFTGMKDCLTSRDGLFNCYMRGDVKTEVMTDELGKTFMGTKGNFKLYSSCRNNHASIDATLALVKEHDIKPDNVEEITAYVGQSVYHSNCEPLEMKQNPSTLGEACFSVPWTVATAIIQGNVEPKSFTEEALKNQNVINLAHKVTPKLKPEFSLGITREPVVIEIKTKDNKIFSKRIEHHRGSTEIPLSMDDIIGKFRNCMTYAVKPIPVEKVDEVVQMIQHLENVTDVSQIIGLLR